MRTDPEIRNRRFLELLDPIHDRMARHAAYLERGDPEEGREVFAEAVLQALASFHTLRDPARFAPWFYRILVHVSWRRRRRKLWRRFLPLGGSGEDRADGAGDPEPSAPDAGHERFEVGELLLQLLERVPRVQREAFLLHEVEGFRLDEVAELQGVGLSAVKSRVARARRVLRARYARLAGEGRTKEVRSHVVRVCPSD
jgi:RNA polymerase sigma-70 factor (ECF subfamily)